MLFFLRFSGVGFCKLNPPFRLGIWKTTCALRQTIQGIILQSLDGVWTEIWWGRKYDEEFSEFWTEIWWGRFPCYLLHKKDFRILFSNQMKLWTKFDQFFREMKPFSFAFFCGFLEENVIMTLSVFFDSKERIAHLVFKSNEAMTDLAGLPPNEALLFCVFLGRKCDYDAFRVFRFTRKNYNSHFQIPLKLLPIWSFFLQTKHLLSLFVWKKTGVNRILSYTFRPEFLSDQVFFFFLFFGGTTTINKSWSAI